MTFDETESALASLLEDAGVRYFAARELLTLGGSHYIKSSPAYGLNSLPPASKLPNIIPTVVAADNARHRLGSPVIVTNAYRSAAYNDKVGGAPRSFHRSFRALDLAPRDPALLSKFFRILRTDRASGNWSGGLGGYHTFVHIDTGTRYDRNWGVKL